jgi:hypothetical protein
MLLVTMPDHDELINKYIDSLNHMEKATMDIAKKILQSSFDIEKSLGFIEWVKNIE